MIHTSFQLPLEMKSLSDKEFWEHIDQMDTLCEDVSQNFGGLALTMYMEHKQITIPFIRFKKNLPTSVS